MIVKQERKSKLPWKKIGIITLIILIIFSLYSVISLTISSKAKSNRVKQIKREKNLKEKIINLVSKKYHVTCSKKIISPTNYNIIKVSDVYRVVVGKDTKSLDDTFNINDCDVMYDVGLKNLRLKD
jgi:hypothetical protein